MQGMTMERKGEILILIQSILATLVPVLISGSKKIISPLLFVSLSMIVAAFFLMFFPKFSLLKIEKMSKERIMGAILIFIGVSMVLIKGLINTFYYYDLLIVVATLIIPFGNIFQKKVVKQISPINYLCYRNLIGGIIVLFMSLSFEEIQLEEIVSFQIFGLILLNGFIAFGVVKLIVFHAMKIIDVSKVVALSSFKILLTFLYAYVFLSETPNSTHFVGFIIMIWGYFNMLKPVKEYV